MANVRLIEAYGGYEAGEVVNLPATVARKLIYEKKALDGKAVASSWQPDKETASITPEETRFPKHTHAGWHELSNGEKVRGKEKAIEAQKELE